MKHNWNYMSLSQKKYDAAYISYVENGESAAVFITRDIAKEVPTRNMWVDVISADKKRRSDGRWDFKSFTVELFPRRTNPIYPKDASDDEKKYITWKTAHKDIDDQRKTGFQGQKYRICPILINRNKDKYTIKKAAWNVTFNRWVPDKWVTPSCEWRERKIPEKAKWEYIISSVKQI